MPKPHYEVTVGGTLIAICFDEAIAEFIVEGLRQLADCDDEPDEAEIETLDQFDPERLGV
jgi:hypothetical protein